MEKLFQSQTENNWGKPSILWPWPETKCNVLLPTNLLCKRGRRGFLVATLEEGYRERDIRSIKIGCKLTQQKSCLSHGKYPFFAVPGNHYEPTLWRSAKYWGSCSFLDQTHCVSWKKIDSKIFCLSRSWCVELTNKRQWMDQSMILRAYILTFIHFRLFNRT